jgi:hypothetical protein
MLGWEQVSVVEGLADSVAVMTTVLLVTLVVVVLVQPASLATRTA